jgi:arabinoxylan arabinofuranohydrolase
MEHIKKQAFNPYLPSYEYIPDGEPYVFGDRVYVFGSHDRFNGKAFCMNDYVCWSAPVADLADWHYEGVIYKKTQDPMNKDGKHMLYAPDVAKGTDGRYYLYYAFDFLSVMAVAVCDTPAGKYEFYGHIKNPDGSILWQKDGDPFLFDPGVLVDDDGSVYLYSGFAPKSGFFSLLSSKNRRMDGGYVIELETDMKTVKGKPKKLFRKAGEAQGTGFEGHEFFEASSIRKIKDTYYFIYSSINGHELCYATSKSPTEGFVYGGTIISNGDLYLNGHIKDTKAYNYIGNNHGSIVEINGQWYVFHYRQTNRHMFSRQGMAEPITILPDGSIPQVELTSCGLNGGPLLGEGVYEARIACHMRYAFGAGRYGFGLKNLVFYRHPYFTQEGEDREDNPNQYIANMHNGAWVGYKYFEINGIRSIAVKIRGKATGRLQVFDGMRGKMVGEVIVKPTTRWTIFKALLKISNGKKALYFVYRGSGAIDFKEFQLKK